MSTTSGGTNANFPASTRIPSQRPDDPLNGYTPGGVTPLVLACDPPAGGDVNAFRSTRGESIGVAGAESPGCLSLEVRLQPSVRAASAARHAVRQHFSQLLSDEELLRTITIVSELVTNSVIHGDGEVTLRIRVERDRLRVEVTDEGHGFDWDVSEGSDTACRGLVIVNLLASRAGTRAGES